MSTGKHFEGLEAWKMARELANHVYRISSQGPFSRDFGLREQMRRAAVSVLSNIAEGFERGGDKEFLHFLSLARGSCGELRAQLYVASDQSYISTEQFRALAERAVRINKAVSGLMRYLQESNLKGSKYKSAAS